MIRDAIRQGLQLAFDVFAWILGLTATLLVILFVLAFLAEVSTQ